MSFFAGLFEKKVVDASALTFRQLDPGGMSKTGLSVNEATALRNTVALACCTVICQDVGKIPVKLLKEGDQGDNEVAKNHPVHQVLQRPNEWQTSMEWRMTMLLHALLGKGGFSFINRSPSTGEVLELIPLIPGRVTPRQDSRWNVTYDVIDKGGLITTLDSTQVHAVKGLTWDGLNAVPLVTSGREAIGLSMAAEETQARLHGQGARPGGVITTTASLTDAQIDKIKSEFAGSYTGVENAFKALLLDNGLKFEPWAMTGVDGQHLETRRFQVEEVCRVFRVFPSMIGHSDKAATYASAESFFVAHVVHTLMPWISNWEQAIGRDLLTQKELRKGYHAKFFVESLLRGDAAARATFYESAITKACWMSRNEARRIEGLNPMQGLDEMLTPLNMQAGVDPKKDPEPSLDDD